MSLTKVKALDLPTEAKKLISKARRGPVLVTAPGKPTVLIRQVDDDDLIDELLFQHPEIKASVRKARREFAAGKGIPLAEARRRLGV